MASNESERIEMGSLAEYNDVLKGLHTKSEQKFPGPLLREIKDTNMSQCDIETTRQYLKQTHKTVEGLKKHFSDAENKLLQGLVELHTKEKDIADMRSNTDVGRKDVENKLLQSVVDLHTQEKEMAGMRSKTEVGRKGAADSGYYSVASCDLAQMSIEEERNNPLIVQAGDQAEQAESVMPEIQETPSEISWSQPSEHTDSCESDTEA